MEAPEGLQRAQLRHFHAWAASLAGAAPPSAICAASVQAALRVAVSGFQDGTSNEEIRGLFGELIAACGAAVAPGPAVAGCQAPRDAAGPALLELRCSVEASNCLAFDGVPYKGGVLKVQRPHDYKPDVAVLLGPTQPDPAVRAAAARNAAAAAAAFAAGHQHALAAAAAGDSGCSFAAAVRASAAGGAHRGPGPAAADGGAPHAHAPGALSSGGGGGSGGATGKPGGWDAALLLSADQTKQDEVFIGGLPSHWKAQQLKELLAPYGQLKSLSVAMDAATGKNKGYAFVVFASSAMVSQAIEELDCRVVEGKILAVQRATDGKATCSRESSTGSDTGSQRDGGQLGLLQQQPLPPGAQQLQPPPQQPPVLQQPARDGPPPPPLGGPLHLPPHRGHHRTSSTGSGLGLPPHAPLAPLLPGEAGPGPGFISHGRSSSGGAGVGGGGPFHFGGAGFGPAGPASTDGVLGQRLLAAVAAGGGGGGGGHYHGAGAAAGGAAGGAGAKQYDVNELYIGDLPLSWDEDAVRRLLGRFGRIKYFTLRNGRDKNFAFCKFKDSSVVDAAIAGLHGKIVDGYFLNVRRAIEGKQQAAAQQQQQQQRLHYKQQQQAQQQPGAAQPSAPQPGAGAAAGLGLAGGGRAHHQLRPPGCEQPHQHQLPYQQQLAKPQPAYGRQLAAAHAQPPCAGPAGAAAGSEHPREQPPTQPGAARPGHDEASTASTLSTLSTVPSPPGTPTVPGEQQPAAGATEPQQQQPHAAAPPSSQPMGRSAAPHGGSFAPFRGQQAPAVQHQRRHSQPQALVQQQQLFQAHPVGGPFGPLPGPPPPQAAPQAPAGESLFFSSNGPASWPGSGAGGALFGAGAEAPAVSGSIAAQQPSLQPLQPQQPQPARQSLLQTWDMLSPWSLFSNTAQ